MITKDSVKELLVPVLKISQVHVLVYGYLERPEIRHDNLCLKSLSSYSRSQQSSQTKLLSFLFCECEILFGHQGCCNWMTKEAGQTQSKQVKERRQTHFSWLIFNEKMLLTLLARDCQRRFQPFLSSSLSLFWLWPLVEQDILPVVLPIKRTVVSPGVDESLSRFIDRHGRLILLEREVQDMITVVIVDIINQSWVKETAKGRLFVVFFHTEAWLRLLFPF